ncbi:hypothetical protein BH20ACT9_BH20ACT9_06120 [soil metagenome]
MPNSTDRTPGYTTDELDRLNQLRQLQQRECAEHLQKILTGLLSALHVIARVERADRPFPQDAFGHELDHVLAALDSAGTLAGVNEDDGLYEGPGDLPQLAHWRYLAALDKQRGDQ